MPKYTIPLFTSEKQKYLQEKGVEFAIKREEDFTLTATIEVEQSRLLARDKAKTPDAIDRDLLGLGRVAISNLSAEKSIFLTKHVPNCTVENYEKDSTKTLVTFAENPFNRQVLQEVTSWDPKKNPQTQIAASEQKLAKKKPFLVCGHEGYKSLTEDQNFAGLFVDIASLKEKSQKHEEFARKIAKLINDEKTPNGSPLDVVVLLHGHRGSFQLGGGEILHPSLMTLIVRENIDNEGPITFDITSCEIGGDETFFAYKDVERIAHVCKNITIILNSGSQATFFSKAESSQYSGRDYKTIIGKIFNPPDAVRIVLYDNEGKYHDHQIQIPTPQKAEDLSDENLRKFLLAQIEGFEKFYRQAKAVDKEFEDYIASCKQTAANMSTQDLAALRAGYCAIDIMHMEEKNLSHYVANGVNLNQIKYFGHSVMKIIGSMEKASGKDIFSALVKNGFDVNQHDEGGNPPYLIAMASNNRELAKKIIQSPSFDPNHRNTANDLPLSFFVEDVELMKLMLQNPKIDLSSPTPADKIPIAILFVSASARKSKICDIDILKQLIRRGANIHEEYKGEKLFEIIPPIMRSQLVEFEREFKKPSQYIIAKPQDEVNAILEKNNVKDFKIIKSENGLTTLEIYQTKMNQALRKDLGVEAKQFEIDSKQEELVRSFLQNKLPSATVERSKTDPTRVRITFENNQQNKDLMTEVDKLVTKERPIAARKPAEPLKTKELRAAAKK